MKVREPARLPAKNQPQRKLLSVIILGDLGKAQSAAAAPAAAAAAAGTVPVTLALHDGNCLRVQIQTM